MNKNTGICEGHLSNGKNCTYKSKYITTLDRVLCGIHLKSEKIIEYRLLNNVKRTLNKKTPKIVEIIDTFDILDLPNEIICYIIDLCDFRSKVTFSLSNKEIGDMFPLYSSYTSKKLESHISSTYTDVKLLLQDIKLFNLRYDYYFLKLLITNTSSYDIASHFTTKKEYEYFSTKILGNICNNKNTDVVTKIIDENKHLSYVFLTKAIKYENLEYVDYILTNYTFDHLNTLVVNMSKEGKLPFLLLLLEKGGVVYDDRITNTVIENNHLHCLKSLYEKGYIFGGGCLLNCVIKGTLEFVTYVFETILPVYEDDILDCPLSCVALFLAKKHRKLDCVKYFNKRGVTNRITLQ